MFVTVSCDSRISSPQVRELEDYLRTMEGDLEVVQDKILAKSHERLLLTEKIQHSEKSYSAVRSDFDKFSDNLEELEAEVSWVKVVE